MFLLVLIMILILTIVYFLVGLLIARLALLWLAWLFSTTKRNGKYLDKINCALISGSVRLGD